MRRARPLVSAIATAIAFCSAALADGYRPESPLDQEFVERLATADIAVLTTVFRSSDGVDYSVQSRDRIVDYLNARSLTKARATDLEPRLAKPVRQPQFKLFMDSLGKLGQQVAAADIGADYALVLEIVFPPVMDRRIGVFGIHLFVLTPDGENAFSFLLNAHHASFRNAGLSSSDTSLDSRRELVLKSTSVALKALEEQVSRARACVPKPGLPFAASGGVGTIADFASELPAGTDGNGIEIGFSTFSGSASRAWMSITDDHPVRPYQEAGNRVLQLDVDVNSWAGVLHRFENGARNEWVAYDWRGARELSFWLHGNDSGTTLALDVLDNRHGCSISDDAERYRYEFVDDFSGWKLISIPFEVMTRADVGNDAPSDGLGLSSVNGWGLGVLKTFGARTYYIDDVQLRYAPILETTPAGELRDRYVWCPINELPMFGKFEKTAWQQEADEKFVQMAVSGSGGDRRGAAEKFAQMGWNFYQRGDHSKAIKRFNQAWLLDADNQHALWGFAVISVERGKIGQAVRFYEMAIEQGTPPAKLVEEYEGLTSPAP